MSIFTVIIIVLLIVAGCLFPKQMKDFLERLKSGGTGNPYQMTHEHMETGLHTLMVEIKRLDSENATLKQRLDNIIDSLNTNKKEYDTFLERLCNNVTKTNSQHERMITKAIQDIESLRSKISASEPQTASVVDHTHNYVVSPVYPEIKYARFLDMAINGFRESEFSATVADSIFEIIIESPDSARFHLVADEEIRPQLFSMMNHVVSPACDIIVESPLPERIVDNTDGLLVKDGDSWTIRKKASIKLI